MSRLLSRAYRLLLGHFFDDFFVVLREAEAQKPLCSSSASLLSSLGQRLALKKNQTPASIAMVLGAALNTQSPASQRILRVEPKPTRVANLICFMIDEILAANSPNLAASILGKFGFLCSTLYGKVGQCCTGAIRRQYGASDDHSLAPDIVTCLQLMKLFVQHAPPRELSVDHSLPRLILYTNASDVPNRPHVNGSWELCW